MPDSRGPDPWLPDELEHRVMEILELPDDQGADALAELYGKHPEHATRIKARLGHAREIHEQIDASLAEPEAHPERIGPYRILEVLGEGGMGTVYLAQQREPVQRRVALKVIKLGMDTKQVLARFAAERQALAIMDHPGIARVLDAGQTEQGRSYFAMEYVRGIPITEFCDKKTMGLRKRLLLFRQVCEAVQHAHQKGIIHRDLKPSNVLVGEEGGAPLPKIIDFGLARATDHRLVGETLITRHGTIVGTPEYMSPEQAEMSGLDVDTRTDIYSLGVLLYELLVGALPFDPKELHGVGQVETRRRIAEDDPPMPSTRVTTPAAGDSSDTASRRRTDPLELVRTLRGDLDWITMKALAKDRADRYQSASELAADLDRFLNDEPVLASPPDVRYRLAKVLRRYRGQVYAASAVVLALVVGLVVTSLLYLELRATRTREAAAREGARTQRDALVARALLADANRLWPAWPEDVGPADEWLAQANALLDRGPAYRVQLTTVQRRALPRTPEAVRTDELKRERALAAVADTESVVVYVAEFVATNVEAYLGSEVQSFLPELRARVRERYDWRFAEPDDARLFLTLRDLVADIDRLASVRAEVERRRERAASVDRVTVEDHRASWRAVMAEVADTDANPRYQGLRITPQRGLIPIGRDPESGLFEFAHYTSGDPPQRDPDSDRLRLTPESGLVFVLLPGGRFRCGAMRPDADHPLGTPNVDPNAMVERESPVRELEVDPFFLSKYEMTQAQWRRVTGRNPSRFSAGSSVRGIEISALHPVEWVHWLECQSVLERLGLALPTEAQWEYAARAGTGTRYYCGTEAESLRGMANIADQSLAKLRPRANVVWDDGFGWHAPVGTFPPNPFGLHDVIGNVREWCHDATEQYVGRRVRSTERQVWRAVRGSSFLTGPNTSRASQRSSYILHARSADRGLRPARAVDG